MKISKDCIDSYLACLATRESCITGCVAFSNKDCILQCSDCTDVCALCTRFEVRDSKFGADLHALCAEICKAYSIE